MKKIFFVAALSIMAVKPAHAAYGASYGYVAVASHTYTAMVSTTAAVGMFGIEICNVSTDTFNCGYDISVSTIAANANLGFPVLPNTATVNNCIYRPVYNIPYCKSTANNIVSGATIEVFK